MTDQEHPDHARLLTLLRDELPGQLRHSSPLSSRTSHCASGRIVIRFYREVD